MANNQLLASDNFASGSLAAGWVVAPNASGFTSQISGAPHYAEAHAVGTFGGQIWTGITWPNDHTSEITLQNLADTGATTNIQLFVRVNGAGTAGYGAFLSGTGAALNAIIYDYAAGTGTVYAGPVNIIVAAGDVFTLQAAGSCITLYHNGSPILFAANATYTGGSTGFGQNVTAAHSITDSQVSSWRGFNCVQQDGIWQKQGIVIAPNATDLSGGAQGLFGGSFILDSNPQLIAGSQVYKTWFSGGAAGSQGTYYAESPDLKIWTRKAAQVISGYVGAMVIKVGSTFYSYSQTAAGAGSGNIALHTSSDGVTFSLVNSNVLSPGAGGSWNASGFYTLRPITVIKGTWYALTTGAASGSGQYKIGLATSPDGQTWTQYAGNPTLSLASGAGVFPANTAWTKVGSKYYFWHSVGPSALQQSSGQDINYLPAECARFSTADFINWDPPVHSFHHSDQYEDLNAPYGTTPNNPGSGMNPTGIFTVGTQTYAIGQAEVLDGAGGGTQFSLAIAPGTLSQIVLFPEDAVQQIATDLFTSGAGPLSANWSNMTGFTALSIVAGNLCEPSTHTGANYAACYTGSSFGTSQYSEVTLHTLSSSSSFAGPMVYATTSGNGYAVELPGATASQAFSANLVRFTAGVGAGVPGFPVGITPTVGDVFRLSVVPSAVGPVISFFQNGSMIFQFVDESASALSNGSPGIYQSQTAAGASQISLWAGGNANVIPNYPPSSEASSSWLTPALANSLRGLKH